jgi:hypothetical protein
MHLCKKLPLPAILNFKLRSQNTLQNLQKKIDNSVDTHCSAAPDLARQPYSTP